MTTKYSAFAASLLLLAAPLLIAARVVDQDTKVKSAQQSAQSWMQLVDTAKYGESWEQAAEPFKKSIAKEKWIEAAKSGRDPLGKITSRKPTGTNYTTQFVGAPPGEYVSLQYVSSFEKLPMATEVVHFMLAEDGVWRAVGYEIK